MLATTMCKGSVAMVRATDISIAPRATLFAGGVALALSVALVASPAYAVGVAPTAVGDRCALISDPAFSPVPIIPGLNALNLSPNTFTQSATGSPNNLACGANANANASGTNSINSAV